MDINQLKGLYHYKDDNNTKYSVKLYMVAFIDILGQSEQLEQMMSFPNPSDLEAVRKFKSSIYNTAKLVIDLNEHIRAFFKAVGSIETNVENKSPEEVQFIRKLEKYHYDMKSFSDSIVIYTPLYEDGESLPIRDVYGILGGCAALFLTWIAKKHPIRCGIDIGPGVNLNEIGIYGPVINSAYYSESKVAKYPRIAIGKGFHDYLNFLKTEEASRCYESKVEREKNILSTAQTDFAKKCIKFLSYDYDSTDILDYLGEGFHSDVKNIDSLQLLPPRGLKFAKSSLEGYKMCNDLKMVDRYYHLVQYYEENLDRWKM